MFSWLCLKIEKPTLDYVASDPHRALINTLTACWSANVSHTDLWLCCTPACRLITQMLVPVWMTAVVKIVDGVTDSSSCAIAVAWYGTSNMEKRCLCPAAGGMCELVSVSPTIILLMTTCCVARESRKVLGMSASLVGLGEYQHFNAIKH